MKARHNPFAADRVETIRYRPVGATFAGILARLERMNYRAAIVGPQGAGKTTLLEDIQRVLERRGLRTRKVFINDSSPLDRPTRRQLMSQLRSDEIVLVDGADAIGPAMWTLLKHRILRQAAGLIITTHRPGRLPTLIDCVTTPGLLGVIVTELLPKEHDIEGPTLDRLYHRYQGNIRNCLRELYDLCASDSSDVGSDHLADDSLSSMRRLRR